MQSPTQSTSKSQTTQLPTQSPSEAPTTQSPDEVADRIPDIEVTDTVAVRISANAVTDTVADRISENAVSNAVSDATVDLISDSAGTRPHSHSLPGANNAVASSRLSVNLVDASRKSTRQKMRNFKLTEQRGGSIDTQTLANIVGVFTHKADPKI